MVNNKTKNLIYALAGILVVIGLGTAGYIVLQGLTPLDAFYFTVITMTSVGYGDITPTNPQAKLFTIFIILTGLTLLFYIVGILASSFVEVSLWDVLKARRMIERRKKMKDHVILCGYGDIGILIAEGLGAENLVIVDKEEKKYNEIIQNEFIGVHGDSTHSAVLNAAGTKDARAMIIALDTDADAVYTILTAKELNPNIKIYVRANESGSGSKMKRAGADYVICLPAVGSSELLKAMGIKSDAKCGK